MTVVRGKEAAADVAWREGRRHWAARRWAAAAAAFRRALAGNPAHAGAQYDLAAALLGLGDSEAGLIAALRASRLAPAAAAAHARLGSLHFSQGRPAEAGAALRRAVALDPAAKEALFYLGACAYNAGDFAAAAVPFAHAARAAPDDAEVQYRLGMALYRAGRPADAVPALARAAALRPGWGEAHHHLGLALMRGGAEAPAPAAAGERPPPRLTGARVVVSLTGPADAFGLMEFHRRNRAHLLPWHPGEPDGRASPKHWQEWAEAAPRLFTAGHALRLVVRLKEEADRPDIIGEINGRLERGSVEACTIGYHIDAARQGAGLMREALELVLGYLFGELGLRRVIAHHDPDNQRSAGLLHRLGFLEIGRFPAYLKVGGEWRDQVVVDLMAPSERAP